jgi:multiple sugar transport system permease protein
MLPALLLLALQAAAIWEVVRLSFYRDNVISSVWVGLANYAELLRGRAFASRLMNSGLYAMMLVPGWALVPLLIALRSMEMRKAIRAKLMFAFYLPTFTSGIIISTVWRWIYHPNDGVLPFNVMGTRWTAIPGISLILILSYMGFYIVLYVSALTSIPGECIDAARIDGCNERQIRWRIRVPIIRGTVSLAVLLTIIAAFQMWETIYMMSPVVEAHNLMYDMYETAFKFSRYGLGSAKAVFLIIIVGTLALVKRRLER